jgi:SAM-dependent methyltransferase
MPATPFCTEADCSLGNCRVLLEREATYRRDGRTERLRFEHRLCERCRMGFVHPVPADDVLACFYTEDYAYYAPAGDHPDLEAGSWKYKLARLRYLHLAAPTAANRLRTLPARLAEVVARKIFSFTLAVPLNLDAGSRILDYGFGTGSWLLTMRRLGYRHLAGYDIAANAHRGEELAAAGIRVTSDLADLAAGSLDCVRLEHVFEHLTDPLGVLRALHRLLRPAGLLVMTFPAIYPWLGIEKLEESPFLGYLQLPIHLAHHSIESASRLVRSAGLELVALRITRPERFITLLARRPEAAGSPSGALQP